VIILNLLIVFVELNRLRFVALNRNCIDSNVQLIKVVLYLGIEPVVFLKSRNIVETKDHILVEIAARKNLSPVAQRYQRMCQLDI
jgi:hypothetical protein